MRIVSLHPACTEWVASFGALSDLVGRSYDCNHPAVAHHICAVTRPPSEPALQRQTERTDTACVRLNEKLLAELKPDVVLAAEGVSARDLDKIRWGSDRPPAVLQLNPTTFKEVLDGALRLGKTIGRLQEAMQYIGETEKNLLTLQRKLAFGRDAQARPTAICIEGVDPLQLSGRWVPELVELAGGRTSHPQTRKGDVSWTEVLRANPDVLALMPPTGGIDAARRAVRQLANTPAWHGLRAARSIRIFAFDGAPFNIPGPRLYRAIELLAWALHPGQGAVTPHPNEVARVRTSSSPAG